MGFFSVHARVVRMLGRDLRIASFVAVANIAVAALQFLDPVLFGRVVSNLSTSGNSDFAWGPTLRLMTVWAGVGLLGIVASLSVAVLADRMAHRNRLKAVADFHGHALSLPLAFHTGTHSGRLIKVMLSGADLLFGLWLNIFRDQMSAFVAVLVLLPMTFLMNWRLASVLGVLTLTFGFMTSSVVGRTEGRQKSAEKHHGKLASTVQDAFGNVSVVQSFARLGAESRLVGGIVADIVDAQFPILNWWGFVNVMTRSASTIAVIAIVAIGTLLHSRGQADVGEIVSFMGFATLLIGKLEGLVFFTARLHAAKPVLEEFFEVMDTRSPVVENPRGVDLVVSEGEVEFRDVRFAYPGGPDILGGVSFTARPGSTVALVGRTGAGKSTAMALMQRLWDPSSGSIVVDGLDLRDATLDSLRRSVGVVSQESMLFNRTIRENLLVGRPDATEDELVAAAVKAEAHEFIMRQPEGYDTMVGERGSTLSGGQRQRLSIARALLKDPRILILDEATSALDSATEARVCKALKALMEGRTTFVIAHRLSTVRDADEILMFDEGRIAERGTFDQLVWRRGLFAELVSSQMPVPPPRVFTGIGEASDAEASEAVAA